MGLKEVVQSAVDSIFTVFNDAIRLVTYERSVDDGFGTVTTTSVPEVELLVDNFTEKDMNTLAFAKLIQPMDMKGYIKAVTIPSMGNNCRFIDGSDVYAVVSYVADPFTILYTLLLRKAE